MPEISEGSVVDGRYRVLRWIGSGGMADVWLADDAHLERRVALKVLHRRFAQDREFVERFRREAEAAAGLQHPNVVAVFDRGDVDGTYYIAMQYVEGRPLKQLIDAGLSPERAAGLIRQVLKGARFAHRHGIVHRDLKPQNVIVDADGNATVTDFGIARAGVSEITQTGSVMGTPHYLSPEQAQGLEVSAVSDLYSIGVILYEALTGRAPFEGESAVAVAMKQVSQTPQRPSSINPKISPALDAVVMRALEKDPGQRFQSADAFIAALDAALQDPATAGGGTVAFAPLPPVVGTPEEAAGPGSDEEHHRRWPLPLAAILIGLLIGLAVVSEARDTTTKVPSVTGNQLNVAIPLLQQNGFSIGGVKRVQREVPADMVLEQDPAASPPAMRAPMNCAFLTFFCSKPKVALTVSAGPGATKVPGTAGLTQGEAVAALKRAGFEAQVRKDNSNTVGAGLVIRSDPSRGATATRGSAVTVTVSSGPMLASVPVLVGTQRAIAVQQIRRRGLAPAVSEQESSAPAGEVIHQSPSAGSKLSRGSSVSIVVSKGVRNVRVPNVIGRERALAVQALRNAGLKPFVQEQETNVPDQIGRVTDQFPPPGTEVGPGTSVTLLVGKAMAQSVAPAAPPTGPGATAGQSQ